MDITIIDETGSVTEELLAQIEAILSFSGKALALEANTEMSVTLMDNQGIQVINRDYRGKDQATDVISFALEELGEDEVPVIFQSEDEQLPRNIGDIMISIDKAKEQAEEYGHSFERELGFLTVHGFLHLNGYDHMTPADEKEMFELQGKLLNDYGLAR
ncbi:rRNA maturation RNase YbeY [Vagococcus salmoninarum]|uniref:Endoribonuclease YbeY n=1 Tax=Vagococcus salmoninarum TaxID=2739 RepID=A0A429ZTZ6_9ENTE|nr:rRNA maturation RNase YbeY [Vagococcus salmoninarum]MBE9388885.1 rRNA maturation RNase YbeY [Vagococcus salmoninarum]RST97204.1 rRNA maturation RNase YbeY [Vagococcus salmoninarum]